MAPKTILICGGAGFIGHHLGRRLMKDNIVIAVDIKNHNYATPDTYCHRLILKDLKDESVWEMLSLMYKIDEVYQLAADMGGAGFVFTGENDYEIMENSAQINLNCARYATLYNWKVFYSSSACIYPEYNQKDSSNPTCTEESVYPAMPDSEYGWEKLFSERLYLAANRNKKLNMRIARFHNIFGPEGTYDGGREKAPAALCRKVIQAKDTIDIWGPGTQTRSFLFIDECIEGILRLMESPFIGPINIGSEEMISINDLAKMIIGISGKNIKINNIPGPVGVNGRNSNNNLIQEKLGWKPSSKLIDGIKVTYAWIEKQLNG